MAGYCGNIAAHVPHYADDEEHGRYICDGVMSIEDTMKRGPVSGLGGDDAVNHPSHYTWGPVEVIEITERLGFCLGNVIKYALRADHKGKPVEDLKKARWYLDREIARREREEEK